MVHLHNKTTYFTWNRHEHFVNGMNDPITGTDVSIRHASIIHRDLFFPLNFNINEVSFDSSEATVVQRGSVGWLG